MNETTSRINGEAFYHPQPLAGPPLSEHVLSSIMEVATESRDSSRLADAEATSSPTGPQQGRQTGKFSRPMRKKLFRWGVFAFFLMVVGIVALMVSSRGKKTNVDPILAYKERFINFRTTLGNYSEPWTFALPNSPQTKSLQWLVFQDQTLSMNPDTKRLVQRHALITLFYACNGENWSGEFALHPPWTDQVGTHECDFHGVTCDETESIVKFEAGQSRLVGQLPDEISLLTHLKTIRINVSELQGTLPVSLFTRLSNLGESLTTYMFRVGNANFLIPSVSWYRSPFERS